MLCICIRIRVRTGAKLHLIRGAFLSAYIIHRSSVYIYGLRGTPGLAVVVVVVVALRSYGHRAKAKQKQFFLQDYL